MRVWLLVEGRTEQQVVPPLLRRWLDGRISAPVEFKVQQFDGWSNLYHCFAERATSLLEDDPVAVLTLLDFYGPTFYPAAARSAAQRLEWATRHFEEQVGDPRFRAFFAVHETEAWLLSQPSIFPRPVAAALPKRPPETVNSDNPPSKLVEHLYGRHLRKTYRKTIYGEQLFLRLDPGVVYAKCPNFKKMLDAILVLVQRAQR